MDELPIKILIADDDKDDIEFLTEAIHANFPQAHIVAVKDGIAALRYIKTSPPPDVVFLDLNMPLKNGLHCLKDIYNLELLPGKPIVIYSTSNKLKDIEDAYHHNAAFYIVKPSSFKELSKIVQMVINRLLTAENKRASKTDFVVSTVKVS